jgi:hypothetical protein
LSLGEGVQPTAVAPCGKVGGLADQAGPNGQLAYAERPPNVVFALSSFEHPEDWSDPDADDLILRSAGTAALRIQLPSTGVWRAWLAGSARGKIDLLVDGQEVGSARQEINYGFHIDFGQFNWAPGAHLVELRYHGSDLHPGSAGPAMPIGPLVFSRAESTDEAVRYLPSARADDLCGRRLDWVEALPG